MKNYAIVLTLALVVAVLALPVSAADEAQTAYAQVAYTQNEMALAWLRAAQEPDGGFSTGFAEGSDFGATAEVVLAATAMGEDVSTWVTAEGRSPLDYLAAQVASGQVSDVGDLSKAVLVAVATGQDLSSLGGTDWAAQVLSRSDPETGMFGDTLFKHAYAVLALHNAGAPIPEGAVTAMTSQFTDDGAWSLFGDTTSGTADTNTTAIVMQALVATGRPDAAAAALPYLRRMQNDDGGFPYQKPSPWGTETDANSTALVIQALNALDEPLGNWASGGTDPVGALLALWDEESGAYFWQASAPFPNMLATAQAVQAAEGMTLVSVSTVGASRPPEIAAGADLTPLLPASGAQLGVSQVLMVAVIGLVGVSAILRRK